MFLRFINRETGVSELLNSFAKSSDKKTADAAIESLKNIPDIEEFRQELEEAVRDLIQEGIGEEFKAFVNNFLSALEEDIITKDTSQGENRSQIARVKDIEGPWIQGFICYNLCLYIKAFGLENLKSCKVCEKLFAHKGKWAVYCSDLCKKKKQN